MPENCIRKAGTHLITWNGRDDHGKNIGSGVYLWKLETNTHQAYGKMMMLR